jgi:hypothetical protein
MAQDLGFSQRAVDSIRSRLAAHAITDADRRTAAVSLALHAHGRGQPKRAVELYRREPQAIRDTNTAVDVVFDGLFADADSSLAETARRTLDATVAPNSDRHRGAWMAAALYDLDKGRPQTARMVVKRLGSVSGRA